MQPRGYRPGVDLAQRKPSLENLLRERARRGGDFLSGAVIERHYQRQTSVFLGVALGLEQKLSDIRRKVGTRANHLHAHVVGVEFSEILADKTMQQAKKPLHFFARARPVFDRERIDGQIFDP